MRSLVILASLALISIGCNAQDDHGHFEASGEASGLPTAPSLKPPIVNFQARPLNTETIARELEDELNKANQEGVLSANLTDLDLESAEFIQIERTDRFARSEDDNFKLYLNQGSCKVYASYGAERFQVNQWENLETKHMVTFTFQQCERQGPARR